MYKSIRQATAISQDGWVIVIISHGRWAKRTPSGPSTYVGERRFAGTLSTVLRKMAVRLLQEQLRRY